MKLLFSTLLVAAMAVSLQAVTVAWTLQNSYWIAAQDGTEIPDWTGFTKTGAEVDGINYNGVDLAVYVFFSTKDYDAAGAADVAGTVGTMATYDMASATSKTDSTLNVYATLNDGAAAGYYYMVIFEDNNKDTGDYIVAKTDYIAAKTSAQGVYYNPTGAEPDAMDYVQLDWVGGTWDDPKMTPEPTALALLALGVAGLALRRKNA